MKLKLLKLVRFFHLINKEKYNEKRQIEIVKKSPLFDRKWYLSQNPDVKAKKIGAAKHYVKHGWKEGRNPSKDFDGNAYLQEYPELVAKNWCPLFHYEMLNKSNNIKVNINTKEVKTIDNITNNNKLINTPCEIITKSMDEIIFPIFNNIDVSIVIPVYNNYHYTKLCLQSILNNTQDVSYEVIIADDNSTDKTKDMDKYIKNIKIIRNNENLRFLKNCNNAAKYASGEYILFLNNDTQVQKGWLSALVSTIKKEKDVGLVGSKLIYPDGSLQEAGGIIYSDASGCNYGRNDNPDQLWYNYMKEVDYISGAAIMLKKDLWNEIGGFDEEFAPAYYEDTDLAFNIRYNKGLKVIYEPKSVVVHFEGKSNGTDITSGQKRYQAINREKFFKKWEKELSLYHSAPTCNNFLPRDHAIGRKNILVIDWKILSFTKDTGSRTTYQYMQFFKDMGFNVKFYPHDWYIEDDYLWKFLDDGFEVIHQNFTDYIKNYGSNFDYIYLNRPNVAPHYINDLRKYTKAKIIYQCHDLHYLRQYRTRLLTNELEAINLLPQEKKAEFDVFSKMDLVCSFSFDEVKEIIKENEFINAKQIPLYILDTEKMSEYNYNAEKRKDIMFVAGFQHTPNVDAAVWFVNEIWPMIKEKNPDIKLYLVGSNPASEVLALSSDDVIVTGFVTDEELDEYYEKIKLVVVPLRTGAGVKGKIIEAAYHKVPVITTDIGIEGINNEDNTILVKNTPENFAKQVNDLYTNNQLLEQYSAKNEKFIKSFFSSDAVIDALGSYINFNICQKEEFAPICLFVYNRIDHPQQVIESLLKNREASFSDLYVFSDGAKYIEDIEKVKELRKYLKTIKGFKSVNIINRKTNYGLGVNLIDGISQVLSKFDRCIVLEDDIVVADNFLAFMNQALNKYKNNKKIFTIQSTQGNASYEEDCCCRKQPDCWGWAIWRDRWDLYERNTIQAFNDINANNMEIRSLLNNNNSVNISWQIDANLRGQRTTWGVYLNYISIKYNKTNIYPKYQLIKNIGQDGTGVHEVKDDTQNIINWNKTNFNLPEQPKEDIHYYKTDTQVVMYNENLKNELKNNSYNKYINKPKIV